MRLHLVRHAGTPLLVSVLTLLLAFVALGCFNNRSLAPEEPIAIADDPSTGDDTPDVGNDDGDGSGDDATNDDSGNDDGDAGDDSNDDGDSNDNGDDNSDNDGDNDGGDNDDNPPPPPIGDTGMAGGTPLSGAWHGWVGRHGMGNKFEDHGSYGTMANNTVAGTLMDIGTRGWFECDIYYDTEVHPGEGGGQHLIGIFSQAAPRSGPYDPRYRDLDGWLRLDLAVRENQLMGVVYQDSPDRTTFSTRRYSFVAWREWATLRVEWEQFDDSLVLTVNGVRSEHEIARGLNPIGNILMVGNMDRYTGERCNGGQDPCGMLGKIRYRDFRWGRN